MNLSSGMSADKSADALCIIIIHNFLRAIGSLENNTNCSSRLQNMGLFWYIEISIIHVGHPNDGGVGDKLLLLDPHESHDTGPLLSL